MIMHVTLLTLETYGSLESLNKTNTDECSHCLWERRKSQTFLLCSASAWYLDITPKLKQNFLDSNEGSVLPSGS